MAPSSNIVGSLNEDEVATVIKKRQVRRFLAGRPSLPDASDDRGIELIQKELDRVIESVFLQYSMRDDPIKLKSIKTHSFQNFLRDSRCFKFVPQQEMECLAKA